MLETLKVFAYDHKEVIIKTGAVVLGAVAGLALVAITGVASGKPAVEVVGDVVEAAADAAADAAV